MAQTLAAIAEDMYGFLLASEAPVLLRRHALGQVRVELMEAAERLSAHLAAERERVTARLAERLDEARASLRAMVEEFKASHPAADRLERHWKGLGASYEALRAHLRKVRDELPGTSPRLAAIKPKNYARNAFHVVMALTGVLTYQFLLDRTGVIVLTGVLVAMFFLMEIMRRSSETWNRRFVEGAFRHIARPGEAHQIPAATWYGLALFIGAILMPKEALQLGALALGFGDPAAQIFGKRFGRRKLIGQKSVAGAVAFVATAAVASAVFMVAVLPAGHGLLSVGALVALPLLVGVVGAIAEVFSGKIDDNFTIPLAAGFAVMPFFM
jgi:dolichol kinase